MSPQARNSNEPNFLITWISIKKTAFFFSPEEFRHTKDATTPLEDSYLITLQSVSIRKPLHTPDFLCYFVFLD